MTTIRRASVANCQRISKSQTNPLRCARGHRPVTCWEPLKDATRASALKCAFLCHFTLNTTLGSEMEQSQLTLPSIGEFDGVGIRLIQKNLLKPATFIRRSPRNGAVAGRGVNSALWPSARVAVPSVTCGRFHQRRIGAIIRSKLTPERL